MSTTKKKELLQKRQEYEEKLKGLYKNFRGIKHEDAASELKYVQIRVIEDFIRSIDEEIRALDKKV